MCSKRKKFLVLGLIGIFILSVMAGGIFFSVQKIYNHKIKIVQRQETKLPDKNLSDFTMEEMQQLFQEKTSEELEKILEETVAAESSSKNETDIYQVSPLDKEIWNILLIGQDARGQETRARSDSMILVSYHKKEKKVVLTSFLRDTWTYIDGYGFNKLNAAFALGGAGLLINTLNDSYGLDIQNYIVVNFDGFVDIVDTMGGISLPITEEEAAYYNSTYPENGFIANGKAVALNGIQALYHANNRSIGKSDFERTRRQREVLFAIYHKMRNIRNAGTFFSIANTALKKVETNIPTGEMLSFGLEALSFEDLQIAECRVPFDGLCWDETKEGQKVLICDFKKNEEKLKSIIYGEKEE